MLLCFENCGIYTHIYQKKRTEFIFLDNDEMELMQQTNNILMRKDNLVKSIVPWYIYCTGSSQYSSRTLQLRRSIIRAIDSSCEPAMAAATDAATGDATTATTTVLVGVDYSEHSYHALEEAARLAAARFPPGSAEVVAVHARRPLAPAFVAIGAYADRAALHSSSNQRIDASL